MKKKFPCVCCKKILTPFFIRHPLTAVMSEGYFQEDEKEGNNNNNNNSNILGVYFYALCIQFFFLPHPGIFSYTRKNIYSPCWLLPNVQIEKKYYTHAVTGKNIYYEARILLVLLDMKVLYAAA